jgi:CRP-like cAMP-binding protein
MTDTSLITLFHGEALFRAGQQATHFYLVTRGSIAVVNQAGLGKIREFGPDELFGIPEVLARGNWDLTAVAQGPTRVRTFPADRLFISLADMPETHSDFLKSVAAMA